MKRRLTLWFGLILAVLTPYAVANVKVGDKVPDFTLTDSHGKSHKLSDFAGKTVVLEWFNHQCPFVKKHYQSGNMQKQQAKWTEQGVVWLVVNSSAAGKQGHVDGTAANGIMADWTMKNTAFLLDHDGQVGRAFGAKVTPHMYVIDGTGTLRYVGAIDSNPSSDPADIPNSKQYVDGALTALASGGTVDPTTTQPYGCSVKY